MNDADPDRMCCSCIADEAAELIQTLADHGATLTVEDGRLRIYGNPSRTIPVALVRRVEQLRHPITAVVTAESIVEKLA